MTSISSISQGKKGGGVSFGANSILILPSYSNCMLALSIPAWNIAFISGVLLLLLLFLIELNQRLSAWLVNPPWLQLLTLNPFALRLLLFLFFYHCYFGHCSDEPSACFHLQWLGHIPSTKHLLSIIIVWNFPVQEQISSVTVSSPLLPAYGTLSHLLFFRLPSTFLHLKGKSITTIRTRRHDFFFFFFFFFVNFFLHICYFDFFSSFLLDILAISFITCHFLPLAFPTGYRHKKEHNVPVLCSHL